ncbi:hypothetical protein EHEL_060380 [Encephalitozoon hellem ATCC 50504]|uniref:uncharacterized protein n=1 Tax=Encephalitozoon hellem (strain ATCC 50504) TaxID=907965 RepID=UPI00026D3674|nr:uncharacterized protein EHEL_060380 [Encephalitozoon hellem ATCC 50504]AFM98411.1 hypothetical protein EHEL_060380 [Encephalitozoon hellem ATCC 50504]|eukprot:XP_003887392.1 hypothetical protein EHEL_060380 [Encephalitozoon hellem ATCC 50504]
MSLSLSFLLIFSASFFHCFSVLIGTPNILPACASISFFLLSDLLFPTFRSFHINLSSFSTTFSRSITAASEGMSTSVPTMSSWLTGVPAIVQIK